MRKVCTLLLVLLVLLTAALPASAAYGNVTYAGRAKEFIFEPGSQWSPTDLFPEFKDVMPGDTITQKVYFDNAASRNVKIRVYMRSLGATKLNSEEATKASQEFLSKLHLKVEKVKDTIMFDAAPDQTAQLKDWTYLGTLYSGGDVELNLTLTVPVTLDNTFQQYVGYLDWEFMIEELPVAPSDPQPPKTGDQILAYAGMMAAAAAAIIVLIILLKKKKKEEND